MLQLRLLLLLPLSTASPTLFLQPRQDTLPPPETWAIRDLSRTCSEADSICQFRFTIDTGAPLPTNPMPAPTYNTNSRSSILNILKSTAVAEEKNDILPGADITTTTTTTTTTNTNTLTHCDHFIASDPPTTPASRGTSTSATQCGAFQIYSGWSHVRSDGTSVSGAEADTVEGAIGHGFTVLSIVDAARGVIVYAGASDEEILSANAAAQDGELGVLGDRRYVVENVP